MLNLRLCSCLSSALLWSAVLSAQDTKAPEWTQLSPVTSPGATCCAGVAYDAARAQVVLFGGTTGGETWVWDGSNWTQKNPASSPNARSFMGMAYDAARAQVVLFGGIAGDGNTLLGETWVWDGITWTEKFPTSSPSPRATPTMACDAARAEVVLFGGSNPSNWLADTWVWDGSNWTQKYPVSSPPVLTEDPSMVYDAARGQVVLFEGFPETGYLSETWIWDGTNWTQKTPANAPPPRAGQSMAYDAASGQTVLFGGQVRSSVCLVLCPLLYLDDTWTWDGSNWTRKDILTHPPRRSWSAMADDSAHGQLLLFGGTDSFRGLRDTWVWVAH